jgi:hypothetical protein
MKSEVPSRWNSVCSIAGALVLLIGGLWTAGDSKRHSLATRGPSGGEGSKSTPTPTFFLPSDDYIRFFEVSL